MSHIGVFRNLWEPCFNIMNKKFNGEQKIYYLCEDVIGKSVPQDHRLSSLCKLSHSHTHDRFLYKIMKVSHPLISQYSQPRNANQTNKYVAQEEVSKVQR